jgi:hypothetical protein
VSHHTWPILQFLYAEEAQSSKEPLITMKLCQVRTVVQQIPAPVLQGNMTSSFLPQQTGLQWSSFPIIIYSECSWDRHVDLEMCSLELIDTVPCSF